jgi:hypothetical protein
MSRPRVIIRPAPPAPGVLPTYVEHGGEPVGRHPADALDIRLYGFVVKGDKDLLDEWCDRCFNEPSGGAEHWRAAGHHLLLNFVDIPRMGSTDPLDHRLGVTPEHEVALWLPVVDARRARLAWAIPYMWVDSGIAMAGGRETYGFPKQLGHPDIPRRDTTPARLSLDADTLATYSRDSVVKRHRVVTVERAGRAKPLVAAWNDPAEAVRALARLLLSGDIARPAEPTPEELEERAGRVLRAPLEALDEALEGTAVALLLARHLLNRNVPMLLLKQFRDAAFPGAACYQAIVEVGNQVTEFRRGGLLPDDYHVDFERLDGEPVERELGLALDQTPAVAVWLEFDFLVHLGAVLWEAGGARHG